MAVNPEDVAELQLKIRYTDAIKAIRDVLAGYKTLKASAQDFGKLVMDTSRGLNMEWKKTLAIMKEVDREFSAISGKQMISPEIYKATEGFIRLNESKNKFVSGTYTGDEALRGFNGQLKEIAPAGAKAAEGVSAVGTASERTGRQLLTFDNLARTVFGTLTAMGTFLLIQFAQNTISKVIDSLKQLEVAFFKISIAEKALSQAGVDISPQDLADIAKSITEIYPAISKIDSLKMVSNIALLTKDLGLTNEQIKQLAQTIPAFAESAGISIEDATNQIVNGLTKSGRGFADLGIQVNNAVIIQEAVKEGLVASAEAYNNLNAEQQQHIKTIALIGILTKSAAETQKSQNEYLKTTEGQVKSVGAAWENFLTSLGILAAPAIHGSLEILIKLLGVLNDAIIIVTKTLTAGLGIFAGYAIAVRELLKGNIHSLDEFMDRWNRAAGQIQRNAMGLISPGPGTDTGTNRNPIKPDSEEEPGGEKLKTKLEGMYKDLASIQEKIQRTEEDYANKQAREEADHLLDRGRKEQDYQIRRARTIQDYNDKRKDIEQKYRDKELNDEAKFQEQLRQLREKYLFNLEDALHERDARQVLRLQRQYQMDKTALINENALKKKQDAQQHAEDVAQAKQDLAEKLREMDEDHRIQMQRDEEDYQLRKKREAEDHARDMDDLRKEIEDKLQELARALGDEYGLNQDGVNAIYNLLLKYYGPNGYFDGLYTYSYDSMVARAAQMSAQLQAILANAANMAGGLVGGIGAAGGTPISRPGSGLGGGADTSKTKGQLVSGGQSGSNVLHAHARGGTFLATRATKAIFGEKEPELASFMPLKGIGADGLLGGLDQSMSLNGNGSIKIELDMSPDLEARVVENTLSKTAQVITKVRRSK